MVFILLVCMPVFNFAKNRSSLDSILLRLDTAIVNEKKFKAIKNQTIFHLEEKLKIGRLDKNGLYNIYSQLTNEYEFYRCDLARQFALNRLAIAEEISDYSKIADSKIQLASILSKAVMFNDAVSLLKSIDPNRLSPKQIIDYYRAYYETYVTWVEFYSDGYESGVLNHERDVYYEAFLKVLPKNYSEYGSYFGIKYIITNQYDKAEKILDKYLPTTRLGSRSYSILNSVYYFLYQRKGDTEKVKKHLALSALSDIEGNIMENSSLRTLATILYDEGDINRANIYINKSMEDANFYNARIRNYQISKNLQIIDKAYRNDRARQQKKLETLLIVISILSVVLLIGIFFIIRQMKVVSKAKEEISNINEKQRQNNIALSEANHTLADTSHIKEEYIGHFLSLCSVYIQKMEKYQKKLYNRAKTSTAEELYNVIRSTQFVDDERIEFYNNFDDSFLKLFPDFVEKFNQFLPEKEQIVLKPNEKLTTELRIFALIRLGITDSAKIAEFLNYSLATIYNYRSRYRNKALIPRDEFENEIAKIGSNRM